MVEHMGETNSALGNGADLEWEPYTLPSTGRAASQQSKQVGTHSFATHAEWLDSAAGA